MPYYANSSFIIYSILKLLTYDNIFLLLTIAELSTLKQVCFFGPPCSTKCCHFRM